MRIGIKYCGGCNPFYDRRAEVQKLEQELKDVRFEPLQCGGEYDRILLVCGCPRACIRKLAGSGKFVDSGKLAGSGKSSWIGNQYLLVKGGEDFVKVLEILKAGVSEEK